MTDYFSITGCSSNLQYDEWVLLNKYVKAFILFNEDTENTKGIYRKEADAKHFDMLSVWTDITNLISPNVDHLILIYHHMRIYTKY